MNQATKQALDSTTIATTLKTPMSAESLAFALGYDKRACKWLVPQLHKLKSEGVIKWKNVNEKGNMHWERVK